MGDEWTPVYETSLLHLAELVKHMLADNDIPSVIMNQKDSAYNFGSIQVYVNQANVVKAKHLISKIEF